MRLWVSTRRWHSRSREASDRPPRESRAAACAGEKADSACHRWPYTRRCRLPFGFLRNRLTICRRYRRLGPLPALPAAVERDDGGPDPEVLPAVPVVLLAVERGVGQHPVPGDDQGRLGHDRAELRGVVGRAGG